MTKKGNKSKCFFVYNFVPRFAQNAPPLARVPQPGQKLALVGAEWEAGGGEAEWEGEEDLLELLDELKNPLLLDEELFGEEELLLEEWWGWPQGDIS